MSIPFKKVGRGECLVKDGLLRTKSAYASLGDTSWKNYQFSYIAKVPVSAQQVQIWAGFRALDRSDRYIIGLKGGVQNELYLARIGDLGRGEFLTLRHLDFPLKPGIYYKVRVQVVGGRIRVFLNNEDLPRIDMKDEHSSFEPKGKITLGGSWIENDFRSFSVKSLPENYLSNIPDKEYTSFTLNKDSLRRAERSSYQEIKVPDIKAARTIISLDGKWLFMPNYEIKNPEQAISPQSSDNTWNILTVPDFWNPLRVWLWGETYKNSNKLGTDSYYQKETARCEGYTFDYKKTNIGWYRQWINLPKHIIEKHIELHFDAVSMVAEVWINGKKAGGHIGMFGSFNIDGTGLFKPGKNLVVLKVYRSYLKNANDTGKVVSVAASEVITQKMLENLPHGFYDDEPAGIWQPVSLVITNPIKITDVLIDPNMHGVQFRVMIKNYSDKTKSLSLSTNITSDKTRKTIFDEQSLNKIEIAPGEQKKLTYSISGINPKLWSPAHPNLYNFSFILRDNRDKKLIDKKDIRSGFKTFIVKNGFFYLNGKRYWLRGADQTPMPIAPNDTALAFRFSELMHEGNINVTRTHNSPYDELWLNASDQYGIGVSYEGIWPWMMIGDSPIPDTQLLNIWANEYLDLVKEYRNHPSMLIWDINNEMDFYFNDSDKGRAEKKMEIISNLVERIKEIDPTHPVVFASGYSHKQTEGRFGKTFMQSIDDGKIDDIHAYPNWYGGSVFDDFNGEFQKDNKFPDRALISEEMSTGYPDETGHAARFYTFMEQTPQTLIGPYSYEFNNPTYFLKINSFLTKEEAEALRRTNPEAAGILHFSLATWFTNVYKAKKVNPFPTYYAIKKALQPVLVSAELWGRHFYSGTRLPVRICVVNDQVSGEALPITTLQWELVDKDNRPFANGSLKVPSVKYYGREWITPKILIPQLLPQNKLYGKLVLKLYNRNKLISANDYDLLFATKQWTTNKTQPIDEKIVVVDFSHKISMLLNQLEVKHANSLSVKEALAQNARVYILSGLNSLTLSSNEITGIRNKIRQGGKILILNSDSMATTLFPEYIRGVIKANQEITMMDIPESTIFNEINPLDTRYFNDNERSIPTVCSGAFQMNRSPDVQELASSVEVHGYLPPNIFSRVKIMDRLGGATLLKIRDHHGTALISTILMEKGITDPVPAKLLLNIINYLENY